MLSFWKGYKSVTNGASNILNCHKSSGSHWPAWRDPESRYGEGDIRDGQYKYTTTG